MTMFSAEIGMCRQFVPCPAAGADPMFEGCTECGHDNMLDSTAAPMMSCFDCKQGYERHMWKDGSERCVRHDMFWDCNPQPAVVAAATADANMAPAVMPRPALPQGPESCDRCFMIGQEMGCAECKPGFHHDPANQFECVPDQPVDNSPNAP